MAAFGRAADEPGRGTDDARGARDRGGATGRWPAWCGVILADTSAWAEYDRATGSAADQRMTELITAEGALVVTEPVMMGVLAGARSPARENQLRRLLLRFELLPFDAVADFDAATRIYRQCRQSWITPRGLLDCMISAVASRLDAPILSHDVDLDRLANVIGLELDDASRRT